ncbi:MAG: TetR/AcrR family transcriptional regulator [Hyphomonadaceae bacterium]|nr:TetR/AcrR family transcriptional regulator [Hyphomonadaceae bacterium]
MSAPDKPDAKLSAAGPAVDDFSRTKSPFCAYMARMTQGSVDRRAARTIASLQRAHLALIIDRGYDQTTVDDICAAAGVSRSAFYAHYRGKDDLKRSGLEQLKRTLLAAQRQALAQRGGVFIQSAAVRARACPSRPLSRLGWRSWRRRRAGRDPRHGARARRRRSRGFRAKSPRQ